MTCYICNKSYSRLQRHLKARHRITDVCIEPRNIKEFALMLYLTPQIKDMNKYKKEVDAFIHDDKDLPKDLYSIFEKYLQEYKLINGIKPYLKIAKLRKVKRKLKGKSKVNKAKENLDCNSKKQTENESIAN